MRRGAFLVTVAALAVVALVACDSRKVYDQYARTPLSGWEKNDTLVYNVPPVAMTGAYEMRLGLRIVNHYPFTAIALVVEQQIFPADTTLRDTIHCQLANERGDFIGCGINCYQYSFHVADVLLQRGDSAKISVRHNMKREILPGISNIGITLTKQH